MTYAVSQRIKTHIGVITPGTTSSGTIGVPYLFKTVTPSWPTHTAEYEPTPQWDGSYDSFTDYEPTVGWGEQSITFDRLTFDQAILVAEMVLHNTTPLSSGGMNIWSHRSSSTIDPVTVFTETGVSMNATSSFVKTLQRAVANEVVIEASAESNFFKATIKLRGDAPVTINAMTAATPTTPVYGAETVRFNQIQLFIDDSPATIHSTHIACNVTNLKLTIKNGLETVLTECGPKHGRGSRTIELEMGLLLDPQAAAQYSAYTTNERRYIAIDVVGTTAPPQRLLWIMASKIISYEHGKQGTFEKITLMASAIYDPLFGYSFQQQVESTTLSGIGCNLI